MVDALLMRSFIVKKSDQVDSDIIGMFQKIMMFVRHLTSMNKPTPEAIGENFAEAMHVFSESISELTKFQIDDKKSADYEDRRLKNIQVVFEKVSKILKFVSHRDWTALIGFIYEQPDLINKSGLDWQIFSFSRVLMQMYQANSADDAKKILTANLEEITSRRNRFDNKLTVDVACLLGFGGGFEATPYRLQPIDKYIFGGLYAPLGVQFGTPVWGLIAYPVDLGTYLNTSSQSANDRVNDAVHFGAAWYFRWKELPVNLGIGGDYKPNYNGEAPVYRGYVFTSLELPLFMLK